MSETQNYLAIDLGAESGRTILGSLDEGKLTLSETHRFPNGPVCLLDGLHWDVLHLWGEIKSGIAATVENGIKLQGLGLDTWGVDFALLDRQGALLGNPFHYRDARTDGMVEIAFQSMPRQEIFAQTGIQFMQLNSLYQLLAMVRAQSPILEVAQTFVTIPDLLNYWLSGEISNEFTNATTTQCFDPLKRDWSRPVHVRFRLPRTMMRSLKSLLHPRQ